MTFFLKSASKWLLLHLSTSKTGSNRFKTAPDSSRNWRFLPGSVFWMASPRSKSTSRWVFSVDSSAKPGEKLWQLIAIRNSVSLRLKLSKFQSQWQDEEACLDLDEIVDVIHVLADSSWPRYDQDGAGVPTKVSQLRNLGPTEVWSRSHRYRDGRSRRFHPEVSRFFMICDHVWFYSYRAYFDYNEDDNNSAICGRHSRARARQTPHDSTRYTQGLEVFMLNQILLLPLSGAKDARTDFATWTEDFVDSSVSGTILLREDFLLLTVVASDIAKWTGWFLGSGSSYWLFVHTFFVPVQNGASKSAGRVSSSPAGDPNFCEVRSKKNNQHEKAAPILVLFFHISLGWKIPVITKLLSLSRLLWKIISSIWFSSSHLLLHTWSACISQNYYCPM